MEIFEIAGKIAGLAGLAIAFVTVVFGQILSNKIFPQLTKERAYSILQSIATKSFILALIGLVLYAYLNYRESQNNMTMLFGKVVDGETPLDDVMVDISGKRGMQVETNSLGKFEVSIRGHEAESLKVVFSKPGFNQHQESVWVDYKRENPEQSMQTIQLKKSDLGVNSKPCPICPPSFGPQRFLVEIRTANLDNASTDELISVTFYGSRRQSGPHPLLIDADDRGRNHKDVYSPIVMTTNIGNLDSIRLEISEYDNEPYLDNWKASNVKITEIPSGKTWQSSEPFQLGDESSPRFKHLNFR